jgi:hypothetical protein
MAYMMMPFAIERKHQSLLKYLINLMLIIIVSNFMAAKCVLNIIFIYILCEFLGVFIGFDVL